MISVSIWRKTLVRLGACAEGLALFEAIAAMQPASDNLRLKRIRVARWTPLHAVWIRARYPSFAAWLEHRDLIPRANLISADLSGADLISANLRSASPTLAWQSHRLVRIWPTINGDKSSWD